MDSIQQIKEIFDVHCGIMRTKELAESGVYYVS